MTAMLIVAFIATLATSLALGQQIWLRQTQNLMDLAQAELLRQGALDYAATMLTLEAKNSSIDDLTEQWAKPVALPVEGGSVTITVEDAQARFNLNNVLQPDGKPNQEELGVFRRLLADPKINANPALAEALVDWLDGDSTVQPGGAEDLDYLNRNPPYRAANRRVLASVDELRLIKDYDADTVNKLRPLVVTLPPNVQSTINVNTAEPRVLAALTNLSVNQMEQMAKVRASSPYKDKQQFSSQLPPDTKITGGYDVKTGYFIVTVVAQIGRTQRIAEALVERPPSGTPAAKPLWYRQPPIDIVL